MGPEEDAERKDGENNPHSTVSAHGRVRLLRLFHPSSSSLPLVLRCLHRYEGLGVKEVLGFLKANHRQVYDYFPEPKLELPKTPKQWICNIGASVIGENFNKWVRAQVEARHQKVSV